MIMATTASAVSSEPTVRAEDAGLEAGGGIGAFAGAGATGRATEVPGVLAGAVPVGGEGGRGTWAVAAAAGAEAGRAAVGAAAPGAAAGDAPVGGNEGSLIVGAAVGFGGSAMRTVSFFGCTLAASGGFGESGVGSSINLSVREKLGAWKNRVKPLIPAHPFLATRNELNITLRHGPKFSANSTGAAT